MLELTTNLLVEIGGWPAMKEARGLVERGRVRDARREGAIITAQVQGAEKTHTPRITLADRIADIEVRCTCAESRRTGRVCAHALAAGLAVMQGATSTKVAGAGPAPEPFREAGRPASSRTALKRTLIEDAPPGTTIVELTILLPLQLKDAFTKDPVRIILEARRERDAQPLPFDAIQANVSAGFAVCDEDDRVLAALESLTGSASGINAMPRTKIGAFLHALDGHPRVWIGKKRRVEVRAAAERPRIAFSRRDDGALVAEFAREMEPATAGVHQHAQAVMANWTFDGETLNEFPALPAGFTSGVRVVPVANIPDFLSRELPALERSCELVFAPGFEEFQLEIGQPAFEARIDGALPGLTLELVARYDGHEFALDGKTESGAYQRYVGDTRRPNRFWRRNVIAERAALVEIEYAGFAHIRGGAATYSLISENNVARFLANTLPRWRRGWSVTFGSRLEAAMEQIDVAQPEFSLRPDARSSSGEDWLSLDLKLSVGGKPIALDQSEIQRWLQTGQNHARTANKRVLLVPTEAWGEMKEVLADCDVEQEPGRIRVEKAFAPYLSSALAAQGFRARVNVVSETPPPNVKAALDEKLWTQLRPYQVHGVEWLARLAQQNLHGLLADDMGLGKTLQALAFCAWLGKIEVSHGAETAAANLPMGTQALVVCPTSLVANWLREAARFVPHLRAVDLTGKDRAERYKARTGCDLLVTSYAILRRDIEQYRAAEFSLVVLDEAQHIKNRSSQNAQAAKALRARHRLILTGTPLENSVLDLWSLFDFLVPGYLGTAAEFKERYETPLTQSPQPKLMERLRHRVRPFFLRRTKEEVLTELPPKLEFPTLVELTDEQREVYRAVLAQGRREVFEHSDKAGRKSGRDRLAVLTTLLRLRQVCCHLELLPEEKSVVAAAVPSDGAVDARVSGSGRKASVALPPASGPRSSPRPPPGTAAATTETGRWREPSAKMERTFELIDEAMDGGGRVLLFSQFVRVLHLLRDEAARREIRFCYLDGQTVERQAEVDRFQADAGIPLFLISLKAGGTGLNLTGADTVIHFDPWWNPAVEEQATSRAHRMGQARRVSAYKLIAAGTVEEKIQALQAHKRELFEASLGGDAAFVEKLSGDDLEELLAE